LKKSSAITKQLLIASIAFFCAVMPSCKNDDAVAERSSENEGVIEFETKAVDVEHPMANLVPNSATLKYKDEHFVMQMSSFGFNTSIFGNLKKKTMTQTITFMDLKQGCVDKEGDIRKENEDYKLNIQETKETKQIAGMKCYKLKVSLVDSPQVKFDAYYTKDLGVGDFNKLTPYAQIKGMLMDYRAKRMGMEMHFKAKEVKSVGVADESFNLPVGITYVSRETLRKTVNPL
jgi:hypothetical protein